MLVMPSYHALGGHLMYEIGKWIPRNWKGSLKIPSKYRSDRYPDSDKLRISSLLTSLKDYTTKGQLSDAFAVFANIRLHVISISYSSSFESLVLSISSLLEACTNDSRYISQGIQFHGLAARLGVDNHPYLLRRLVTFYSAFNLVFDAHCLAESSNSMNPLRWNVVISTYVRNGLFQEALLVYKKMMDSGIRPDNFTIPSVLKACGEQMNLNLGKVIHGTLVVSNRKSNIFVQNALISMYGKCGEVKMARELFDKMLDRDSVSWNSIVALYASRGMWDEARCLFEKSRLEASKVNVIRWNTMLGESLQMGKFEEVLKELNSMRTDNIRFDDVGVVIGLTACSNVQFLMLGQQYHAYSIHGGCDDYHNIKNALINMYSRCDDLKHAYIIFQSMEHRSLITWNTIISGYSYWDKIDESSFLFREMLLSGFEPNYVTIASILPLCGRVANLQHGTEFHCYIIRREKLNGCLVLWNSVIDMYARSGKILHAQRLFDSLSQKNEITYTSLISGYGAQGQGGDALKLLKEMIHFGIKPDHITLLAVLSACSHSGLVNKGQQLFERMETDFDISPKLEHYACMVDLFGRAGLLSKATEVIKYTIKYTPYKPTSEMWVTLLGVCRIHGNMKLGEWAAKNLLEMRPANSGYYVLIANMYAASGCWDKLATVRTIMRDLGVINTPGHAWVDLGTGFYPFSASDASAELVDEIYLLLDQMTEQMKDSFYGFTEDFLMDAETLKEQRIAEEDSADVKIWHSGAMRV